MSQDLSAHPKRDTRYGDIYLCSTEHPMPTYAPGRWEHADVREVGEQADGWPGGDIVTYECRCCGHRWRSELPQ